MAKMNRKAIFFSLVSVFIVTIFYLSIKLSTESIITESEMETTRARVEVLNAIINDMDDRYFSRMLYISGKSALGAMSEYAYDHNPCRDAYFRYCSGTPEFRGYGHNDESQLIKELNNTIMTGELTQADISGKFDLDDYNMEDLIDELEGAFEVIGIKIEAFEIDITSIEQVDAWNVKIGADIRYYFSDAMGIASWQGETHKEALIDIYGLYDPKHNREIINFIYDTNAGCTNFIGDENYPNGCVLGCDCIYEPSFIRKLRGYRIPEAEDVGFGVCPSSTPNCNNVMTP